MATAEADQELASTPMWVFETVRTVAVGGFLFGLAIVVLTAPVHLLLPQVYPAAVDFAWLTVLGATIPFLNRTLTEEEVSLLNTIIETYLNKSRRDGLVYLASIFVLGVTGISVLVGVTSVVAAYLVTQQSMDAVIVALPLFYPSVDMALGRYLGWNLASTGGLVALLGMSALAILYDVSPDVPREAGRTLRASL